jgi:predicted RNA polymerase sigma factor
VPTTDVSRVEQTFRQEFGRVVATLVRLFGDIDLAEEAVQEAFAVALERWPATGVPPNPGGWIVTTARNQAIDRLRREASRQGRHAQAALLHHRDEPKEVGPVPDDHLRLARLLAELMPDEPEVLGLLALLLLTEARRAARTAADGSLVLLSDQDRSQWSGALIAEGQALVAACIRRDRPGPYQVQAAINAVHSDASTASGTDWGQILQLYDQLLALSPTPVVALNRAVAVAEVHGPAAALAAVDSLELGGYHLFHATRADLLRRLGRQAEAADAYDAALALVGNAAERRFLDERRRSLPVA